MQSLWDQGLLASTLSYVGSLVADAVNVGSEDGVGGRWSVWEVVSLGGGLGLPLLAHVLCVFRKHGLEVCNAAVKSGGWDLIKCCTCSL